MKNCLLIVCGVLVCTVHLLYSQPIKPKSVPKSGPQTQPSPAIPMGILVKAYENSVAIRWSPSEAISWEMGKQYGYHIYRQEYVNNQRIGTEQQLTTVPIRPVTEEELKKYTDTSEVAKKAFFSMIQSTPDASLDEALKKDEGRNFTFGMALIMANIYPLLAKLSGLMYTDATVTPYRTYYYEVRLNHPELSKTVRAWAIATPGATQAKLPAPFHFSGKSIKHNAILQWRTDFVGFGYAYYDVYRSEHHDRGFKKLNKLPYVGFMSGSDEPNITKFQDTLPRLDKSYYYKIVGTDPFGEHGPWSETVLIKAKQSIYYNPVIQKASSANNKTVTIEWHHPEADKKHIKGYVVQRAFDPLAGYTNLNTSLIAHGHHKYEDKKPLAAGFYRIATVGIAEDTTYSMNEMVQLIDSIPPHTPIGIVGIGDTNGIVTLHWHPNKEEDFYGYRIFRTFGNRDEYTRVTQGFLHDTLYRDTISKKLGYKKVIYSIVALDQHYNPSHFSPGLEVKFPDITPPSAPRLIDYQVQPHKVMVKWNKSLSMDVVYHVLMRKGPLDYSWVVLDTIRPFTKVDSAHRFVDTSAVPRTDYLYTMQAVDDYGLKSELSNMLNITALGDPFKPMVKGLQAFVSTPNNMIKLVWQYDQPGVNTFVIYRKSKEGKMQMLKSLPPTAREHYDKAVQPNSEYSYYIMAQFNDWSQSLLSDAITVKY